MLTYTSLDGIVLDLARLSELERRFLERAHAAYKAGVTWAEFANSYTNGPDNPVLERGRRVSRAVAETPLYQAIRDLEDRVGIACGKLRPSMGDHIARDPFDDSFVTIAHAATQKGVSVQAVHKAIGRRTLVATNDRPARVSQNSLDRWSVNGLRQFAGKIAIARS